MGTFLTNDSTAELVLAAGELKVLVLRVSAENKLLLRHSRQCRLLFLFLGGFNWLFLLRVFLEKILYFVHLNHSPFLGCR